MNERRLGRPCNGHKKKRGVSSVDLSWGFVEMRIALIGLALLAVLPGLAMAQNVRQMDVAKATTGQTASVKDEDRQVCRVEKQLGSNRSKRVCRSAAQVERDREQAREELTKATSQIN